ncbi:hypothetical protein CF326_g3670 [Tilletia indica]|nr:hypothetical protein CF326_g3670 [Tilletia indica]
MSSIIEQELAENAVLSKQVEELDVYASSQRSKHRRADHVIYCFNHALNRAMQDLYRALGVSCADAGGVLGAADDEEEDTIVVPATKTIEAKTGTEKAAKKGDHPPTAADGDESEDDEDEEEDDEEGDPEDDAADASAADVVGSSHLAKEKSGTKEQVPEQSDALESEENIFFDPAEARAALSLMRDFRQLPAIPEEEEEEAGEGGQDEDDADGPEAGSQTEALDRSGPIDKIARFTKIVHSSSEAKREYLKLMKMFYSGKGAKNKKLREKVPPKLNHTRWNSRFKQLSFALEVPAGYNFVCKNSKRQGPNGYTDLSLSNYEIALLEIIHDVGELVQQRTLEFEKDDGHAYKMLDRFADLVHVLTIEIDSAKNKVTGDLKRDPFIQALEKMRTKIRRYQSLAAGTSSVLIAAVLHPKYRLTLLTRDYPELVDRARQLLEEEVAAYAVTPRESVSAFAGSPSPKKDKWKRAPVEDLSAHVIPKISDVGAYLGGRYPWQGAVPETDLVEDKVLGWWRDNEKNLPVLSRVARKYLCAPAATSAVERVFSRAGRYVSNCRPLGPTTLRHLVMMNALILGGYDPNVA